LKEFKGCGSRRSEAIFMTPNVNPQWQRFLFVWGLPFAMALFEQRSKRRSWEEAAVAAALFCGYAAVLDFFLRAVRWRLWWRSLIAAAAIGGVYGGCQAWREATHLPFKTLLNSPHHANGYIVGVVIWNALVFGGMAAGGLALYLIYRERNRAEA
jgi:hypothetical protein